MEWNNLSIPKLQRCSRWIWGMDNLFHPTHCIGYDYLSMLVSKLIYVSKRGPSSQNNPDQIWVWWELVEWLLSYKVRNVKVWDVQTPSSHFLLWKDVARGIVAIHDCTNNNNFDPFYKYVSNGLLINCQKSLYVIRRMLHTPKNGCCMNGPSKLDFWHPDYMKY